VVGSLGFAPHPSGDVTRKPPFFSVWIALFDLLVSKKGKQRTKKDCQIKAKLGGVALFPQQMETSPAIHFFCCFDGN
jgi:hypothetical protein